MTFSLFPRCWVTTRASCLGCAIWQDIFKKLCIDYFPRQIWNLQRNCSDRITISYSCHIYCTIGIEFLYGKLLYLNISKGLLKPNFSENVIFNWKQWLTAVCGALGYFCRGKRSSASTCVPLTVIWSAAVRIISVRGLLALLAAVTHAHTLITWQNMRQTLILIFNLPQRHFKFELCKRCVEKRAQNADE